MLSILINEIFEQFDQPKKVATLERIFEYKRILENWMENLPTIFEGDNTNARYNEVYPWVRLHRYYLHTTALVMMVWPMRPYMVSQSRKCAAEVTLRDLGVCCVLRLLEVTQEFFEFTLTSNMAFASIQFRIFDPAAYLCFAVLCDGDDSILEKKTIRRAVMRAIQSLKQLMSLMVAAKTPFNALKKLVSSLPPEISTPMHSQSTSRCPKRAKIINSASAELFQRFQVNSKRGTTMLDRSELSIDSLGPTTSLGIAGIMDSIAALNKPDQTQNRFNYVFSQHAIAQARTLPAGDHELIYMDACTDLLIPYLPSTSCVEMRIA